MTSSRMELDVNWKTFLMRPRCANPKFQNEGESRFITISAVIEIIFSQKTIYQNFLSNNKMK